MSAALLAVVSAGVYAGIDGPTQVSSNARARASAVSLAQADQERLRSMRFVDLQNYGTPAGVPRTIDGVTYTVTSRTAWVEDSSAAASCAAAPSNKGDYLKLTSTVSWPAAGNGNPVTVSTLLAPPVGDTTTGTGNIVMNLVNESGNPVAGVPVSISGRTSQTQTTTADGCAVFASVPSGNYTVSANQAGYVDKTGSQAWSMPAPVTAGDTQNLTQTYARAGTATVAFKDPVTKAAITYPTASIGGGSLQAAIKRLTSPQLTQSLFPDKTSSYFAWAGGCADPGPTYDASWNATPGGSTTMVVYVPQLTVTVPTSNLPSAPTIVVKSQDGTCGDAFSLPQQANSGGNYVWQGRIPYGHYTVCAQYSGYALQTPFKVNLMTPSGGAAPLNAGTSLATSWNANTFAATGTATDPAGAQPSQIVQGNCP